MKHDRKYLTGLAFLAISTFVGNTSGQLRIVEIKDLGTLGGSFSSATSISEAGHVAGQSRDSNGRSEGFVWHASSGMKGVGFLPASDWSTALGVNSQGRAVGWTFSSEAFISSPAPFSLTALEPINTGANFPSAQAFGMNRAAQAVGWSINFINRGEATLWQPNGARVALGFLHPFNKFSQAFDISNAGVAVGHSRNGAGITEAVLWTGPNAIRPLGFIDGGGTSFPRSKAHAINDSMVVVGESSNLDGVQEAFRWDATNGLQRLGFFEPGGNEGRALDINNIQGGEIIVGSINRAFRGGRAFMYHEGQLIDLNDLLPPQSGWLLSRASGINDSLQIAGSGRINGESHAFIAQLAFNTPPTITCLSGPGPFTARVGSLRLFAFRSDDSDAGDILSVEVQGLPEGSFALSQPVGAAPLFSTLSFLPTASDLGQHSVTVSVTDQFGHTVTCFFEVVVIDPPVCDIHGTKEGFIANIGEPFVHTVTGTVGAGGGPLFVRYIGLPPGMTTTPPHGTFGDSPMDATFHWTPTFGEVGSHKITASFTDQDGITAFCRFVVAVVNRPPSCSVSPLLPFGSGSYLVEAGQTLSLTFIGEDPDPGDILTAVPSNFPPGATLSNLGPSPQSLVTHFEWTPTLNDIGIHFSRVHFVDLQSIITSKGTCNFSITVVEPQTPTGTDVVVEPVDSTTGTIAPITLEFDEVISGGETTVTSSIPSETQGAPEGFRFGNPPVIYQIETTAEFSGDIEVCFDLTQFSFNNPEKLKLFHSSDGTAWQDITSSNDGLEICGLTSEFSFFVVFEDIDQDDDGLTDEEEELLGTNPNVADTDGDGIDDGVEVDLAEFGCPSPILFDSDGDGLSDGLEILLGLDPCEAIADYDADGLLNAIEVVLGTDPVNPDSDNDGLLDGTEIDMAAGTDCPNPLVKDSDGDGLYDGQEVNEIGSDPCSTDTDGDGINDFDDPLPIDPGVTNDFAADMANDIAAAVGELPLEDIIAPNNNARKGRRNSLANRLRNASKALLKEDYVKALDLLYGVLAKMDGQPTPKDWVLMTPETTLIIAEIELLITLVELEV